jgi:DNA-binding response OmpR family regulator
MTTQTRARGIPRDKPSENPHIAISQFSLDLTVFMRSHEGEHPRVLIVEDDPSIRRALGRVFRSAGHDAQFATTLQDGLAKLNGHRVVLVDLQLPDGCGTTLLQKIRHEARPIRVAIYSGLIDAAAIVRASGETPDAIFQKPVDFDQLLAWLTQVKAAPR